jgi:hypothetical protein
MPEGVTSDIATAMQEVNANVFAEDCLMLRTCEHGIRHPVGHLDNSQWARLLNEWAGPRLSNKAGATIPSTLEARHEQRDAWSYQRNVKCCGCCPHGEA